MTAIVVWLRALPKIQVTFAVALLVLGFLITAQVTGEKPRAQYSTQERAPLIQTVLDLQTQQEAFKARILELRRQIGDLEAQDPGAAESLRQLYADLEDARLAAGLIAISGPGLAFRLEDGTTGAGVDALVSAQDVRILLRELWLAGAEAIDINGERVASTSAVIDIGGSILVNSAYLAPPYEIRAIGPPDLYDRLRSSVAFVDFVQGRIDRNGMSLSVAPLASVDLDAYAGTVNLRYASPAASGPP
ncbi:MAG TPA: DUF881 domain-containing protein [Patescibacteria group bacterium]|nr:DUF881 domain-containing protein [Patescibacteria group bacterium]